MASNVTVRKINSLATEVTNTATSVNTVNEQLNNKLNLMLADISNTKTSLNTIGTKIDAVTREITK